MIDTMINFGYLIYFRKKRKKEKEIRVQVIKILKISHEHL